MEGVLLQTVEGLGDSPFIAPAGEMWELLQAEKENIEHEIIADRSLRQETGSFDQFEPSDEAARELEWHHRGALEDRLREVIDAQDRLIDGGYGLCIACGKRVSDKRLIADPAAEMCVACRQQAEG